MKKYVVIKTDKPIDIHNAISINTHCCKHYSNVPSIHPIVLDTLEEAAKVRSQKEHASWFGSWEIIELDMEEKNEH